MRILLIGPFPPPHGGISVHVSGIHRRLVAAGEDCAVLDTSRVHPGIRFAITILRHACKGWTLHSHTNGHNVKSWFVSLFCAAAGRVSGGCILTLHSGMAPEYLEHASLSRWLLASVACRLSQRVICASTAIRDAVIRLGTAPARVEVLPAFVGAPDSQPSIAPAMLTWMQERRPLLSTVLFFRPEYGFDVLVEGLVHLHKRHPELGCVVMGSGENHEEALRSVRNAGLEQSIFMAGDVDHDACLAVIAASDVFVRPSREDGDSISVREAISLGVPTVASDAGTRPDGTLLFARGDAHEMVARIENALAVEPQPQAAFANCIDRLMEIYREGGLCPN